MKSGCVVSGGLFVIGTCMCLVGYLVGIHFGKPILDQAKASESWPTVNGTVLESDLEKHSGESTTYSANIVYRYTVEGEDFDSDRVWFGGGYSTSNRSEMQDVVREYPVGQAVTVHYSPENPAEAVLKPGAFTSSYVLYVIGLVFLVIGGLMLAGLVLRFAIVSVGLVTAAPAGGSGTEFRSSLSPDSNSSVRFDPDDDGFDGIPGS